jgi:signal transduction histidine kinase
MTSRHFLGACLIRWILETKWKPEFAAATIVFLALGSLDLVVGDWLRAGQTAVYALGFVFLRNNSYLTGILLLSGSVIHLLNPLPPTYGDISLALAVFAIAIFTSSPWREINALAALVSAVIVIGNAAYNPNLSFPNLGVFEFTDTGRLVVFTSGAILVASLLGLAWLGGRLIESKYIHNEFQRNRKYSNLQQDEISLELAEQAKRFEMAGDMNDSAIQSISSVITNAEAGLYTSKLDPNAGIRALEKILVSAKSAHSELRRLYETINKGSMVSGAPPTLDSISALETPMREAGYELSVRYSGAKNPISSSMELAIYRIVFEALKNVKQHNPKGTMATVELTWFENNLQVIIRDNGVEVVRKRSVGANGLPLPYDANDDIQGLLEKVVGPGITAMRERVESFGGSLEAQRVVGIGFTVSALFPISRIAQA